MRADRFLPALACAAALLACAHAVRAGEKGPALAARTLVVGTRAEPKTLNPLAITASEGHQVAALVFLKLMEEQEDFLTFQPQLAESWSASDDGLAVTFRLRADARWSDGTPVTAADVRFTWELHVDTTVAWPGAAIKSRIRDVEVRDARTVTFHFTEKYLYQLMDANDGVILPRHLLHDVPRRDLKSSPFGRAPVGNGPWMLARWESGQYMEFARNPRWYGPAPRVEKVLFKFVPDAVTLTAQLRAGEIDLLESVPPADLPAIRDSRPDVVIHDVASRRMNFIAWNGKRAPFDDREVRRALTTAIDRAEIIRSVWGGYARECTSPMMPLLWAYDNGIAPLPHDPAAARSALAARGFTGADGDGILERDGRKFEFELLVNDVQARVDIATLVQAHLRAAGVKVNLRVMEYGAYIDRILAGDYDAAVVEWKASTRADLTQLFHTRSQRPAGFNFTAYSNPEADRLIDEALSRADAASAKPLWSQAQRMIYDDQPFTFLAVARELTALDDRFCNVKPNAISVFANLADWGIAPDCAPR